MSSSGVRTKRFIVEAHFILKVLLAVFERFEQAASLKTSEKSLIAAPDRSLRWGEATGGDCEDSKPEHRVGARRGSDGRKRSAARVLRRRSDAAVGRRRAGAESDSWVCGFTSSVARPPWLDVNDREAA
jgi:hypothetical protein